MGFLSRKNKFKSASVADEPHPIVEELEEMEEVIPERSIDAEASSRPATGPVAAGDPPPPAVAKASSGAVPPTAPPVEERIEVTREPTPEATAPPAPEVEETPAESERFMPRDLLAPSRHEVAVKEPEVEVPVKHADVIAFANQKGGVAKTTTTLNLAVAFAESGYRVLCVDLDPQGNLTMSQGIDPDKVEKSLYDVLVHDMPMAEIIQHREIDIAVASIDLAGAEIAMSTKIGRERSLQKALKEVSANYDFVCIDTPPSLGLLTINALTAANKVIVPVQCEYLSMRGLVQLQNTLKMIQENLNPDVRIEGILPTMLDTRTVHAKEAVEILEENFGELVFKSRIRKAIKFAEAPVKGASVLKYDPQSNAAGYYRDLAKEVLEHESA
jgi:chromosome partitioning protein